MREIQNPTRKVIEPEKVMDVLPDKRGIRLDVYVENGENETFDCEMQVARRSDLPKRSRYYQSIIDLQSLQKGKTGRYKDLKTGYVIFICKFDPFNRGEAVYFFENSCRGVKNLSLDDGTYKVFVNAESKSDNISPELRSFLRFIAGDEPPAEEKSILVKQLAKATQTVIADMEWRQEYMYLSDLREEWEEIAKEEGIEQGLAEGIEQGLAEGIEQGLAEGIEQERKQMVAAMYQNNISIEKIAMISNLEIDAVKKILASQ